MCTYCACIKLADAATPVVITLAYQNALILHFRHIVTTVITRQFVSSNVLALFYSNLLNPNPNETRNRNYIVDVLST